MNLVTGTGVRFHTGRMAGSSFGAHTGRRTVCRPCAVRLEAQNRRGCTGGLLWLASAGVRIWMLLIGEGLLALAFLSGLPVLIPWRIWRWLEGVDDPQADLRPASRGRHSPDAMHPRSSQGEWREVPSTEPQLWQPVASRSDAEGTSTYPATSGPGLRHPDTLHDVYRDGETPAQWLDRILPDLVRRSGLPPSGFREQVERLTRYCMPRAGETLEAFVTRARDRVKLLQSGPDPETPEACYDGEQPVGQWLARTMGKCVHLDEDQCLETIVFALIEIADDYPPVEGEGPVAWLRRVGVR